MDDPVHATYRQWQDAEDDDRDDEADAALMAIVSAVGRDDGAPTTGFTAAVMAAVSAAAERDARLAQRTRRAVVVAGAAGTVVATYFGGLWVLNGIVSSAVWLLDVMVGAIVGGAMSVRAGEGVWGVLTSLGRATSAFVSDPMVTVVLIMAQGIAIAALAALHRLLGNDREWLK